MHFDIRHRVRARVLAVIAVTGLTLPSCLFDTRDAQDPGDVSGGCTLETPNRAFICMTQAIADQKDADYERSISENFVFSPTVADSLDQTFAGIDPSPYANWDKNTEMTVLGLLFSEAQSTVVDFGSPSRLIDKNTFVRFDVNYTLDVVSGAPPDTVTYKGNAWIDVRNEGGNWRVTFWDEIETVAGFSTWGYLRGIYKLQTGTALRTET